MIDKTRVRIIHTYHAHSQSIQVILINIIVVVVVVIVVVVVVVYVCMTAFYIYKGHTGTELYKRRRTTQTYTTYNIIAHIHTTTYLPSPCNVTFTSVDLFAIYSLNNAYISNTQYD